MSRERFRSVVKNISKIFARVDEQQLLSLTLTLAYAHMCTLLTHCFLLSAHQCTCAASNLRMHTNLTSTTWWSLHRQQNMDSGYENIQLLLPFSEHYLVNAPLLRLLFRLSICLSVRLSVTHIPGEHGARLVSVSTQDSPEQELQIQMASCCQLLQQLMTTARQTPSLQNNHMMEIFFVYLLISTTFQLAYCNNYVSHLLVVISNTHTHTHIICSKFVMETLPY